MSKPMTYKGYSAHIEYNDEDGCFVGRITGIRDIITFHGESVQDIKHAFEEAVYFYHNTIAMAAKIITKVSMLGLPKCAAIMLVEVNIFLNFYVKVKETEKRNHQSYQQGKPAFVILTKNGLFYSLSSYVYGFNTWRIINDGCGDIGIVRYSPVESGRVSL